MYAVHRIIEQDRMEQTSGGHPDQTFLRKQGHLEQVVQDYAQMTFEVLQKGDSKTWLVNTFQWSELIHVLEHIIFFCSQSLSGLGITLREEKMGKTALEFWKKRGYGCKNIVFFLLGTSDWDLSVERKASMKNCPSSHTLLYMISIS